VPLVLLTADHCRSSPEHRQYRLNGLVFADCDRLQKGATLIEGLTARPVDGPVLFEPPPHFCREPIDLFLRVSRELHGSRRDVVKGDPGS